MIPKVTSNRQNIKSNSKVYNEINLHPKFFYTVACKAPINIKKVNSGHA